MIPFKNIPSNIRVPLFYAEVDNSQANTATAPQVGLIVGQMLGSGTAAPGVPVLSQGVAADTLAFGAGSMAALMIEAWRANDNFGQLWVLPLADDGAAVAATGKVSFTGPATAAGTLSLYVGGVRVETLVTAAMTAAQLATAVAASINANANLPVTAAVNGVNNYEVDLTAKNKGPGGNEIDLRLNYQAAAGGEATPAGIVPTITAMASGATPPSLTTPFANCNEQPFDFIAFPYTDTTSLNAIQSFLNDQTGRWSWDVQVYGGAFSAYRGTLATVQTFGLARNDPHMSVMGFNDSPSPAWIWAAAYAAVCSVALQADPARPLHTLAIAGVLAPPLASRFALSDRNTLLFSGVATFAVDPDGTVRIEGDITTYQLNSAGAADNSYLKINTLYNLAFILRTLKGDVTSKYARMKLAADGTRFAAGSAIVTPGIIRAEIIANYRELEFNGNVQGTDAFKAGLIVEINATNPNRVDVLWPGILIGQLDIFALLAQFRLIVPSTPAAA